jgi:hypothetical protein
MRSLPVILLFCLLVVSSAGAVTSYNLGTSASIKNLPDVTCSDDAFATSPGNGVIWVIFTSDEAGVLIDGKKATNTNAKQIGGKQAVAYTQTPGTHTLLLYRQGGYSNVTVKVQTCAGKASYVYYDSADHVITTKPTTIVTTTTAVPTTTTAVQGSTTQVTQQQTQQVATQAAATAAAQPDTTGSLSVTTTPAGATILIDGVMRGASPATIPGIPAGSHTLLLKLDGYQDMSTPVTITAGKTQDYSTAMIKNAAAGTTPAAASETTVTPKKSPGFEYALALAAVGAILLMKRDR